MTPLEDREIILGEGLGRLGIAFVQGLIIMIGGSLIFDIRSGDLVAAGLTLFVFCLVAAATAMLLGRLTPGPSALPREARPCSNGSQETPRD